VLKKTARLALLLFLTPGSAWAARPELERELDSLVTLFYDMNFDAARAAADALAKKHPGHPAGPFYQSVTTYQHWIAEGMRSQETYRAFEASLDAAQSSAGILLQTDPAEGHYYLGAADGFRARALAGQRRYFKAVTKAASAVKHLKEALRRDPGLEDARLGLGMYHYFASRMPGGAKPFAHLLFGERGNRNLGLQELWRVARSTGAARMEARSMLSMILAKDDEANWAGAERILAELCISFPHNPIYRLRRAYVAQRRGDFDAAISLSDPDGTWIKTLHPSVRAPARNWALYRAAESLLMQGRLEEAGRRLANIDDKNLPRGLEDWVLLRRGNLADASGHRGEADSLYERLKDKNPSALARRFREERFPKGPRDVAPFFAGY